MTLEFFDGFLSTKLFDLLEKPWLSCLKTKVVEYPRIFEKKGILFPCELNL